MGCLLLRFHKSTLLSCGLVIRLRVLEWVVQDAEQVLERPA